MASGFSIPCDVIRPKANVYIVLYTNPDMASYLGYFLLGAGVLGFLIARRDRSRRSLPLMFTATMMIMGGLAILQFLGSESASL